MQIDMATEMSRSRGKVKASEKTKQAKKLVVDVLNMFSLLQISGFLQSSGTQGRLVI